MLALVAMVTSTSKLYDAPGGILRVVGIVSVMQGLFMIIPYEKLFICQLEVHVFLGMLQPAASPSLKSSWNKTNCPKASLVKYDVNADKEKINVANFNRNIDVLIKTTNFCYWLSILFLQNL
jgi:hypothetical protein